MPVRPILLPFVRGRIDSGVIEVQAVTLTWRVPAACRCGRSGRGRPAPCASCALMQEMPAKATMQKLGNT